MTTPDPRYAVQSRFSDPGPYAELLRTPPPAIADLAAVVRNTIAHYRTPGVEFTPAHLQEINNRWVEKILACDQSRFPQPLDVPRPYERHVAGCCRDYTLLSVAALRAHGVPARSRIGFADYFFREEGFHADHVIVDYWDGQRWVFADAQLDPGQDWGFDPLDMPRPVGDRPPGPFATAAQIWTAYRRGEIDDQAYGVHMELPFRGGPFIRDYVILELAHRQCDELLLWDRWGAMSENPVGEIEGDLGLIDELAGLLLAADEGDTAAEAELEKRYVGDDRLHPGSTVVCISPTGTRSVVAM
jgi:Transglutaminase-like superfamily